MGLFGKTQQRDPKDQVIIIVRPTNQTLIQQKVLHSAKVVYD